MPSGFAFKDGWGVFKNAIDPKAFKGRVKENTSRANRLNAQVVLRQIRQDIKAGTLFKKNAALTVAIKRSTKPLVDFGSHLFQALTWKTVPEGVFVGVLMANGLFNVAVALHEGSVLRVTPKMRGLFAILQAVSMGQADPSVLRGRAAELWDRMPGGWEALRPTTRAIVIPPRPFIKHAFDNPTLKATVAKNWADAMSAALSGRKVPTKKG